MAAAADVSEFKHDFNHGLACPAPPPPHHSIKRRLSDLCAWAHDVELILSTSRIAVAFNLIGYGRCPDTCQIAYICN